LPHCVVPCVVGQRLRRAKTRIRRAHCKVGAVKLASSTLRMKGRVLRERPAARRRLRNGARVNLTVGKGPKKK
ncbi:MAG: PASTA domain-containing protein, partial [Gaiellaceae bacterium]